MTTDRGAYFGTALGAEAVIEHQRLSIYIPDKDRDGVSIDARQWVKRAVRLLSRINKGATAMPAAYGVWKGKEERTVIVYSHMDDETFDLHKSTIRGFLHRFGREARQDSVLCEIGPFAIFISQYDTAQPLP